MANQTYILPMRFRLNPQAPLDAVNVATFDYPYAAVKKLQDQVDSILRLRTGEYPPLRQLGSVLSVLVPGLVHSFYYDNHTRRTQPLMALSRSQDEEPSDEERHQPLLALGDNMEWLPPTWKVYQVIEKWAELWLGQEFLELSQPQQQILLANFRKELSQLEANGQTWQSSTLGYLWQRKDGKLYSTLPALFASLLSYLTQENPVSLEGIPIHWYLAVSTPFGYRHKIAHGFITTEQCTHTLSAMVIWLFLKVAQKSVPIAS